MVVIVNENDSNEMLKILNNDGVKPTIIGKIRERKGNEEQVQFTTKLF